MDKIDYVVIGAGVVGLAIARKLAVLGNDVIIIEKETAIGTETSSRNSEVIHAGIYYPTNSLKAKLCVQGNQLLYEYCEQHNVDFKRCGKLIVATNNNQIKELQALQQQAVANNVPTLTWLDKDQVTALEPELNTVCALLSPSTGIIDSHGYMLALQGDLEANGGMIALNSPVQSAKLTTEGIILTIAGDEPFQLLAKNVINCAGLYATQLAQNFAGLPKQYIPKGYYAKGSYFSLAKRAPFSHLIYPVPEAGGLGVHLTLDLAGQARFGPDVEWITELDYSVDQQRCNKFYAAIRNYWPNLPDDTLQAAYSGIRPKITPQGATAADFRIDSSTTHGVNGLINLFGIESPGLTASLAIADYVVTLL